MAIDSRKIPDNTKKPAELPVRIAKHLSRAGVCSRRQGERWINEGRIELNGQPLTSPVTLVTTQDQIKIDGKPLLPTERTRLWLFHKPAGLLSTNCDPHGRATLFSALPSTMPRVMSIGRLDMSTEGLLLLTNDGGLARTLELPMTGWLRRYRVRAFGMVSQERLDLLAEGIAVDGMFYGAIKANIDKKQGANNWLTVAIREGKNNEIKKVLASIGLEVNRLIRVSYGPFQLADLPVGGVREIRSRTLRDQLGNKLVKASGANFDSPIHHIAPEISHSTDRTAKQNNKTKPSIAPSIGRKQKPAKGQIQEEKLARISTRKPKRKFR